MSREHRPGDAGWQKEVAPPRDEDRPKGPPRLAHEDPQRIARPYPCPECSSTEGYHRVGKFRAQCKSCNALLKNDQVNLEDIDLQ